jgi:hypothetical protein
MSHAANQVWPSCHQQPATAPLHLKCCGSRISDTDELAIGAAIVSALIGARASAIE